MSLFFDSVARPEVGIEERAPYEGRGGETLLAKGLGQGLAMRRKRQASLLVEPVLEGGNAGEQGAVGREGRRRVGDALLEPNALGSQP